MKNTNTQSISTEQVRAAIVNEYSSKKRISAWNRGVMLYALDLLEDVDADTADDLPTNRADLQSLLLNGASNWDSYSWGGCSFIYDSDIAERLCTPSELRKTRNGERRPNSREEWLDTQARALYQASNKICSIVRRAYFASLTM